MKASSPLKTAVKRKYQRPGEQLPKRTSNAKSVASKVEENEEEIEEFIKTVDDDVLENKYSSSFEGNRDDQQQEVMASGEGCLKGEMFQLRSSKGSGTVA